MWAGEMERGDEDAVGGSEVFISDADGGVDGADAKNCEVAAR
jgi:hypothetical protein